MSINLKTLISKLNDTCRTAATRAASLCVGLGQYEVDLEHVFLALLEQPRSDFVLIARRSGVSVSMLEADLRAEVARPRGSRSLSTHLKSRLGLDGVKAALLHELLPRQAIADPQRLAAAIKALPVRLTAARRQGGRHFTDHHGGSGAEFAVQAKLEALHQ